MEQISTINFKCERCGKCCKHRGDLALTPMDVFQIAKHLKTSCEEIVRKYTRLSHRHNFPQLLIEGTTKQSICIFYDRNTGCKIYPIRPAQCYLFPLVPLTPITISDPKFSIRQCTSKSKTVENISVSEWIKNSCTRYEAEKNIFSWYIEQQPIIDFLCYLHKEKMDLVKQLLYCQYDLEQEMEAQIKKNITEIIFNLV